MSEDDVHRGVDGWLFLVGGTNKVLAQTRKNPLIDIQLDAWRDVFARRYRACKKAGCAYFTMIAPEKIYIYDDKLGDLSIDPRSSLCNRLHRRLLFHPILRRSYIELSPHLRAHRSDGDLYQRTDTHWTLAGCQIAYRQICRACRARAVEDFHLRERHEERSAGDLGSKFEPAISEDRTFYRLQSDSTRVHANAKALLYESRQTASHRGIHHVYRNPSARADPRTLMLVGDSYSDFPAASLVVMLAETFREVHFIWSPAVDWAYFARVKPDILIGQIAERFLRQVTADTYAVEP
jgi:hypothetical protein